MVIYWIELGSHGIYIDYQQHHVDVQCKTLNITENLVEYCHHTCWNYKEGLETIHKRRKSRSQSYHCTQINRISSCKSEMFLAKPALGYIEIFEGVVAYVDTPVCTACRISLD